MILFFLFVSSLWGMERLMGCRTDFSGIVSSLPPGRVCVALPQELQADKQPVNKEDRQRTVMFV